MRVVIKTSGRALSDTFDLEDGETVLLGRSPDVRHLTGLPETARVNCRPISSPNVSANHVLVERHGNEVRVLDLASRNGTWVRIPSDGDAKLSVSDIAITLGSPTLVASVDEGPEAASWTGEGDYAEAIATAVEAWLRKRDIPARIGQATQHSAETAEHFCWIPLATRTYLTVEPSRTVQDDWFEVAASLERYVASQNLLFRAEETLREEGLVVASPAMRETVARVVRVANGGAKSLLLLGPSGAGKEGLARCFHRHAQRAGRFTPVNCAILSREFARSELFGAEKGAFTGSVRRIVGAVETAHEGTLFLDEVGDLPSEVQPMLLRFLDRGVYEPLGHSLPRRADVRLVCATNRDLRAASVGGQFRLDLWFRLSAYVVEVPPLRRRPEDLLAYLGGVRLGNGRILLQQLEREALAVLQSHSWEGNFRELGNFCEQAQGPAERGRLTAAQCAQLLAEGAIVAVKSGPATPVAQDSDRSDWASLWERAALAFSEDHASATPHSWDDVKDFIEGYLKPLMFAHLSRADTSRSRDELDLRAIAERVQADRGTAAKQLDRFLDRFVREAAAR